MWEGVLNAGRCTHGVAYGALQRSVLFGLAADVVEGEQQMVVVRQVGRNLHLHLLVKLGRPSGRDATFKAGIVRKEKLDGLQSEKSSEGQ